MKNKTKILVADDNEDLRLILKRQLTKRGHFVETASNGYEVITYLRTNKADIVILDLIMPEKGGIEIISAVKGLCPLVKIIIYTGMASYQRSPYTKMVDKFVLKGGDIETLFKALDDLL